MIEEIKKLQDAYKDVLRESSILFAPTQSDPDKYRELAEYADFILAIAKVRKSELDKRKTLAESNNNVLDGTQAFRDEIDHIMLMLTSIKSFANKKHR